MKVLGIETSCDETAVAVVENGKAILVNLIASQIDIHKQYGGVFPEVASRHHVNRLLPLVEKAIEITNEIDLIAVTNGPGLMGALLMGVTAANTLGFGWDKPVVGVNHIEAHIYAAMIGTTPLFPALGVVVSGGHTLLIKMQNITSYEILGTTVDDAAGEAFDKVATLLEYPYPGGPHIEKLAIEGDEKKYHLRSGQIKRHPFHFSFSGLKTQILYLVKGMNGTKNDLTIIDKEEKKHIAASFQRAIFKDIVKKSLKAALSFPCRAIYFGGGVTQNKAFRQSFTHHCPIPLFWPPQNLGLDNAVMIAGLGYHLRAQKGEVQAFPRISTKAHRSL